MFLIFYEFELEYHCFWVSDRQDEELQLLQNMNNL